MIKGYLISGAVGLLAGAGGMFGISKAFKPQITVNPPKVEVSCPECPQCPPSLGNELEKVKGKYITLNLNQTLLLHSDSLALQKLLNDLDARIDKKFNAMRVARCK